MLWKLFGLQKKLDALFDDGWVTLGLSSGRSGRLSPRPAVEYPRE
jgi:hypothetical protein